MSAPQFTPGPWNVSKHGTPDYAPQFGINAEGQAHDLATVKGERAAADAALIASAPEMLAALEEYQSAMDDLFSHCLSNGVFNQWGKRFDCTSLNAAKLSGARVIAKSGGAPR